MISAPIHTYTHEGEPTGCTRADIRRLEISGGRFDGEAVGSSATVTIQSLGEPGSPLLPVGAHDAGLDGEVPMSPLKQVTVHPSEPASLPTIVCAPPFQFMPGDTIEALLRAEASLAAAESVAGNATRVLGRYCTAAASNEFTSCSFHDTIDRLEERVRRYLVPTSSRATLQQELTKLNLALEKLSMVDERFSVAGPRPPQQSASGTSLDALLQLDATLPALLERAQAVASAIQRINLSGEESLFTAVDEMVAEGPKIAAEVADLDRLVSKLEKDFRAGWSNVIDELEELEAQVFPQNRK